MTSAGLVEFALLAEELGYDSIWLPEMWGRSCLEQLAMLAVHTNRIRLCTGAVSVYSRSPAAIASSIATIDEMSDGRAVLGLGTSGSAVIEGWHGLPYERPLRRTREYVDIIRLVLSGARVNYAGEIFNLANFRLQFTPPRGDIPIFIAAMGPKNIGLTGEIADGWIPFLMPPNAIRGNSFLLTSAAEEAGRSPGALTIAPYIPACVYEDERAATAALKDLIVYYVAAMGTYYAEAMSRWGFHREVSAILELWGRGSKDAAVEAVSEAMLDEVTVHGPEERAREKLGEFGQAAGLPIIIFPRKATPDMVRQTLIALAPRD